MLIDACAMVMGKERAWWEGRGRTGLVLAAGRHREAHRRDLCMRGSGRRGKDTSSHVRTLSIIGY